MDIMNMPSRRLNSVIADIFSRLHYMKCRGSGFKKIVNANKEHDGYTEGMDPTFSTPCDSFVMVLSKFNIVDVEGVYAVDQDGIQENDESNNEDGRRWTVH